MSQFLNMELDSTGQIPVIQPTANTVLARYRFNSIVQGDRSFDDFLGHLRVQCTYCMFKEPNNMIRDRIVFGINDPKIREILINEGKKLNLNQAILICKSFKLNDISSESSSSLSQAAIKCKSSSATTSPNSVDKLDHNYLSSKSANKSNLNHSKNQQRPVPVTAGKLKQCLKCKKWNKSSSLQNNYCKCGNDAPQPDADIEDCSQDDHEDLDPPDEEPDVMKIKEVKCQWESCTCVVEGFTQMEEHLRHHGETNTECKWKGCGGMVLERSMSQHVLQHVYDTDFIKTINDWIAALPSSFDEKKTNLNLCPIKLRSKLGLHLFDEDYFAEYPVYTVHTHRAFLNWLSKLEPTKFQYIEKQFIQKRSQLGENWSPLVADGNYLNSPSDAESSHKPLTFVPVSIAELSYKYFSGSKRRRETVDDQRKKKKAVTDQPSPRYTAVPWCKQLFENLNLCKNAIEIQSEILRSMLEHKIVSTQKQSFMKIEQEMGRLSSRKNCCSGVFAYSVFRCNINKTILYYIRYVEYGVYSGFMNHQYLNFLKEQLGSTEQDTFLHNVLTQEDIEEKARFSIHAHENDLRRIRPDKIYKFAVESMLPSHVKEMEEIQPCPEVALHSFTVHALPHKAAKYSDNWGTFFESSSSTQLSSDINEQLVNYRLADNESKQQVSSKDILKPAQCQDLSLLQQSILLNCLSGDTNQKNKAYLYTKSARFTSNFIHVANPSTSTSLRNRVLSLFLKKRFNDIVEFFLKYFPDLQIPRGTNDAV